MAQRYFATINPGLEAALLTEVRALGGKRAKTVSGGVEFDATNTVFYRAAYRLRCANRLWLRMDEFRARDAGELSRKTARIDWARVIAADVPVEVRGISHGSRLNHTGTIAEVVQQAINASLGREQPLGDSLTVLARVADNRCELSLDASGDLLYQRGYKQDAVAAPLRESVASALLRTVNWTPEQALIDPFCGSGTIAIEAAASARGLAAGSTRGFALQRWANFRPPLWDEVCAETHEPTEIRAIAGFDSDPQAITASRHNAARAQVEPHCTFSEADVDAFDPHTIADAGWIVTNPPWNERLPDPGQGALNTLLKRYDAHGAGWNMAVVAPRTWNPGRGEVVAKTELGGIAVSVRVFRDKGAAGGYH